MRDLVAFNSRELRQGRLVACIGSSIFAQGMFNSSSRAGYDAVGPFEWAATLSHQRFIARNAAVSGQTSSQMLARIDEDVLAHKPDIVVVQNGTNEIGDGVESIWTNTKAMYDKVLASGSHLIACAILPRSKAESSWSDTNLAVAIQLNERKRRYCLLHPRAHFADLAKYITDPEDQSGQPLANMLRDGTHWTPRGAFRGGQILSEIINSILPPTDILSASYIQADGTDLIHGPVSVNPSLERTTGILGSGATGVAPAAWRIERTSATTTGGIAGAKLTPTGFDPRNMFEMTFTPGAGGDEDFYLRTSSATMTLPTFDDPYEALVGVDVDAWDGFKEIAIEVDDQGTPNKTYIGMSNEYQEAWPTEAWSGIIKTPPIKFQDGGQRLRVHVTIDGAASGTGKLRVYNPQLRRLDPNFMPVDGTYDLIYHGELNKE